MRTFQAVGIMVGLEDGLSKEQVMNLLSKLPDDEEFVQFDVSENNSTIWGFMTVDCADDEEHYTSVITTCKKLCEDFDNERTDKVYMTKSGIEVFVDCECETVREELAQREFRSEGNFVTVETDNEFYSNVIICPKPNAPWMHLLEASNGDVKEIKTAEIISVK